ncbi:hypothetical protein [Actinomadura gamaensis]|uniref:Alpha-amylase n=1 Tax=Actinomadura gamaensis TaxID=1763541 RepID=A0ABV9TZ23_9ACTN
MRRLLTAAVASSSLLAAMAFTPEASAASAAEPRPRAVPATAAESDTGVQAAYFGAVDASNTATATIRAVAFTGVARVDFRLRLKGSAEPYLTVPNVPLKSGDGNAGYYTPRERLQLRPGRSYLDVDLTDTSGAHTLVPAAAFADTSTGVYAVAVTGATAASRPFQVKGQVFHRGAVGRVTGRLYDARTARPVGAEFELRPGASTEADQWTVTDVVSDPIEQPDGAYSVVLTARDEQGDTVRNQGGVDVSRPVQQFAGLTVAPETVDADHRTVTITGRLLGGDGAPQAGVRVRAEGPVAETVTDGGGAFSLTVNLSRSKFTLVAAAHGEYAQAVREVAVQTRAIPTTTVLSAPSGRVRVGSLATFTGQVTRAGADGKLVPLANQQVSLRFTTDTAPNRWVASATTDANGRYSAQVNVPESGTWTVTSHDPGGFFADSRSAPAPVAAAYPTEIVGATAPRTAAFRTDGFTFKGKLLRKGPSGAGTPVRSGLVRLLFSPDGRHWASKNTGSTRPDGSFEIPGLVTADGYWRADYAGQTAGTGDLPSSSAKIYVDSRYPTFIAPFDAGPEPVKKGRTLTVKGRITKYTGRTLPGAGAVLKIYFKPRGSAKWKAMASVKADRNGWFTKAFKASADGTWAAAYAGSGAYMGDWSEGDYVDVR